MTNYEEVKIIKEKNKSYLLKFPNVIGIGVGPKVINNKSTDIISIKVYVSKKINKSDLKEKDCLPETVDDIPIDVEELDTLKIYDT